MLNYNNKKIETDKEGYLKDSKQWNTIVAEEIAKKEAILLSKEHWEIIFFVRKFYLEFNTSPSIRILTKEIAQKFGEKKGNSRYLYKLFPKGPAKCVTKIAGLPKPSRCI